MSFDLVEFAERRVAYIVDSGLNVIYKSYEFNNNQLPRSLDLKLWRRKYMNMRIAGFCLLIVAALSISAFAQTKSGIQGVWQITEVTTTGKNGSTNRSPQPGMYIFTKKHYSIIYVSSDSPRAILPDVGKATADELRSVFVDSFVANAGKYDLEKGKLHVWPMVAKSPGYMQSGQNATSSVKIVGNTMTITSEETNGYPVKDPTTMKFTRVE